MNSEYLKKVVHGRQPFCLIQKQDDVEMLALFGKSRSFSEIKQIPRKKGASKQGLEFDTLSIVPFSQIREKGCLARDTGDRILTLVIEEQTSLEIDSVMSSLPGHGITLSGEGGLQGDVSEAEYEALIEEIIRHEIGNGEGANFVVPRTLRGNIENFNHQDALAIFKRLLERDYGTYWKYLYFTGDRYFIGSTPERHLNVEQGKVRLNPISGTFRKKEWYENRRAFKKDLLDFLNTDKEINELFMVTDEELKMMARMCEQGGAVVGPLLKEMSKLIHTEYLLSGESSKDIFDLFIESMFAATVSGSPVENACRIIHKYEPEGRSYYGSAMMLVGRDESGQDYLDSPITIRTWELSNKGELVTRVGATLVRDSVAKEEVAETICKSAALRQSLELQNQQQAQPPLLPKLANDDEIQETLQQRNQYLSNYWFFRQQRDVTNVNDGNRVIPSVTLIHNEDDFSYMLQHMLVSMGYGVSLTHWNDFRLEEDTSDITIVGPGPGNPCDEFDQKIRRNRVIVDELLVMGKPSLFICLGHQMLSQKLGLPLIRKKDPSQGIQKEIDLFGQKTRVGFYNTFTATLPSSCEDSFPDKVKRVAFSEGDEIAALRGEHFLSYQFHPESILTKDGYQILLEGMSYLSFLVAEGSKSNAIKRKGSPHVEVELDISVNG